MLGIVNHRTTSIIILDNAVISIDPWQYLIAFETFVHDTPMSTMTQSTNEEQIAIHICKPSGAAKERMAVDQGSVFTGFRQVS
jgi:hypothetical protein